MLGSGKIWVILIIIVIVSTTVSGFIFFSQNNPEDPQDLQNPHVILQKYNRVVSDLRDIKERKPELAPAADNDLMGNRILKYSDSRSKVLMIEVYKGNSLDRIDYYTNDDKRTDVIEYYTPGSSLPEHTEYDTGGDGIFDIYEKDSNNDGIISVNEIRVNMNGKFLPLGSLGIVAM